MRVTTWSLACGNICHHGLTSHFHISQHQWQIYHGHCRHWNWLFSHGLTVSGSKKDRLPASLSRSSCLGKTQSRIFFSIIIWFNMGTWIGPHPERNYTKIIKRWFLYLTVILSTEWETTAFLVFDQVEAFDRIEAGQRGMLKLSEPTLHYPGYHLVQEAVPG